ncbi:MAG: phosphatidate cytidylyltransferase [Candidatus Atribacteria bacterium]|nr:phosphatidate cytidylyltransferase [Candidatus Atribacteria bacterium]
MSSSLNNELEKRIISVAVALPLFLLLILLHPLSFIAVFIFLSGVSMIELARMYFSKQEQIVAIGLSLALLGWFYFSWWFLEQSFPFLGWYLGFLILIVWIITQPQIPLEKMVFLFTGWWFCIIFPFFWVKTGFLSGRKTVIFLAFLVWLNDIFAYFLGKKWGRHKVVPNISPGKSWEGLLGGLIIAAFFGGVFANFNLIPFSPFLGFLCGFLLGLVGFLGDIFESSLKRRVKLKDSGNFLPGHGGVLDRFDSFFTVGPLVFILGTMWGG